MSRLLHRALLCALFSLIPTSLLAQGPVYTPNVHALTNVRIVTSPGRTIEQGTVVVRDGLIEAVGANVAIPDDAQVWELDSLTVYAGLIDPAMEVKLPKADDEDDLANLDHHLSVVKSQTLLATGMPFKASDREARRAVGITTARMLSNQGAFRGEAAIANLGKGDLSYNLIEGEAGQVAAFSTAKGGGYPGSLMGVVAVMRQTLHDAQWYNQAMTSFEANPRGLKRPEQNAALEALRSVASGQEELLFITDDVLDLLRAHELAAELGLSLSYIGSGEEYKRIDEVKTMASQLVLPVHFPKAPGVSGEEGKDLSVSLEKLRHWDNAPKNPTAVYDAGIEFAFTAHGLKDIGKFREKVSEAIQAGLPHDAALASCTTVPAKMLGLSEQMGRVETGMVANLVVTDGAIFDPDTKVRAVWVDGNRFEVQKIEKPEGDPRGTWDYVALAGGAEYPGTVILGGELGALTATVVAMDEEIPAEATQSGSTVSVVFSMMGGQFTLDLNINGDNADGSGSSPFGDFSLTATRVKKHSDSKPGNGGLDR
ncbi:MAG: amidohydrolase family protein [Candidatus Eisenbacteria bacterium]|uniref:Amidohydrolase family protein n=1 Tax=Eiseniibacteriota bacterium TaxID=2212470 RepID=A0A7Y2EDG7_UNCEI|nr:amidohydrolase family protein [Candidatus Eisenbacteria bacterium]